MRRWVALAALLAVACGGEEFAIGSRVTSDGGSDSPKPSLDGAAAFDTRSDGPWPDAFGDVHRDVTDSDARDNGTWRDAPLVDMTAEPSGDSARDAHVPSPDSAPDAPLDRDVTSFDTVGNDVIPDARVDVTSDAPRVDCSMMLIGVISTNHGHSLQIPLADISAGFAKFYNVRGAATHDHFVLMTASDFSFLKAGGTIFKRSCNTGDHEYAIACSAPSRQPGAPTCTDECGLSEQAVCP
jgi:hypothetical protein